MKILINDLMQFSDLPDDLKTPSLDDNYPNSGALLVTFSIPTEYSTFNLFDGILSQPGWDNGSFIDGVLSQPISIPTAIVDGVLSQPMSVLGSNEFNCIGIGGTDATELTLNGDIVLTAPGGVAFIPGLYEIGQTITASTLTIEHNGTYMGRIAVGECREICTAPSVEPGFFTSNTTRRSLSGAVIPSAGGYGGQVVGVDVRYKIDEDIYTDFQRAYVTQIMQGFPFFIDFELDDKLPVGKFYGQTDNEMIFQNSTRHFLYSRRFEFTEAF